jgi:hypothetical protein
MSIASSYPQVCNLKFEIILSVVGVLSAADRLKPSGTYCFASGKRVY